MTDPRRTLQAIADLATNLTTRWSDYQTIEADLAPAPLAATNYDTTHSSDVPRPVETIVAAHITYWGTCDDVTNALTFLRSVQHRVDHVQRHHAGLAHRLTTEASRARCDGSWDPTCVNNAVRGGKCWRCIKAVQRAQEQAEATG